MKRQRPALTPEQRQRQLQRYRYTPGQAAAKNAKRWCNDPRTKPYADYGGRGIKYLLDSYDDVERTLGPRPSPLYSLDRIDNDGDYVIGNLRWATRRVQNTNRRHHTPAQLAQRELVALGHVTAPLHRCGHPRENYTGKRRRCKICWDAYVEANRERLRAYHHAWHLAHKGKP